MFLTKKITNGQTLRMLERAGKIKEPLGSLKPANLKWGKGYSYVDADTGTFTHKGRKFTVQYADGCFFPFVYEQFSN